MSGLWPFLVIGLFSGSIYALASMGIVLTYKTSGVFNFAYGGIAMFCGFTFWQLRDGWHISSWLSLPILLLVVAPVMGLTAEYLFRSVITLSAEIQIVIALAVLAFLQALVPIFYGGSERSLNSIFPTSTFRLGSGLHVSWTQLFTLLLAVAAALLLSGLLSRTRLGLATRAVVDNRDLAELNGVSSDSVSRLAWVISTVFAALAGVLLSSTVGLDTYSLVLFFIYAFAPAVLAKLVNLPAAFGWALGLGVLQSILQKYGSSGNVADFEAALPYLALFGALVFYGNALKEIRSSFRTITVSAPNRDPRRFAGSVAAVVVGLAVLPLLIHGSALGDVSTALIYAAIALTLVVLTGWAGQISLAQFSFVGIGAFTAGHLAGAGGKGFLWAAVVGALIAVPFGIAVGLPSLRLSGLFLALATMAFALIMDTLVFPRNWVSGGYTGTTVARPDIFGIRFTGTLSFYWLSAILLGVYALGASLLNRGPVGRRLQMMRDAPLGASTFGVNLTLTKLAVFAGCGAAAAFAGAFYGAMRLAVDPNDFAFGASLELLLLVVLGGRALVPGGMVAGGIYLLQLLPLSSTVESYIPLGVAVGAVALAQYPEGPTTRSAVYMRYFSALFRRRPLRELTEGRLVPITFPSRRRITADAAEVADAG
ncbi:MAG TPA: ABC transporter permease [Acidimicrobiales bacterium]|nr:ABC transporter permease [Acidimicrobiales bacterium]